MYNSFIIENVCLDTKSSFRIVMKRDKNNCLKIHNNLKLAIKIKLPCLLVSLLFPWR